MTYYKTCFGCAKDSHTCERRQGLRKSIKGLGITSVGFICPDRSPRFIVGEKVIVTWRMIYHCDGFSEEYEGVEFRATVLKETTPGRYLIKVDDGEDLTGLGFKSPDDLAKNGYANVSFRKLKADPQAATPELVCKTCLTPASSSNIKNECWWCGPHKPDGCLCIDPPERDGLE